MAKINQILGCQSIFKYKTDEYNYLWMYKARLVVYKNKQKQHDLSTRATNLTKMFLCILLIFIAKFNLEIM